MTSEPDGWRAWLPSVSVTLALAIIFVVVLSIPLAVAADLGLTTGQLTGWIVALYGSSGVLTLVLVWRYRQPLLVTGNVFVLIFVASLGGQLSWSELIGASMLAGAAVLVLGLLRLTDRVAVWLPSPIVFGVLAGAVLDFFVGLFDALGGHLTMVGAALVAYLVGRRLLEPRVPAVLPALVVGLLAAWLTGGLEQPPARLTLPVPELIVPTLSVAAVLTATPVITVLIALQANAPSVVFLRNQGFDPPERPISIISGAGTVLASTFGPMGVSLSLPATALTAGADAGAWSTRHRAAALSGAVAMVVAVLAGYAAELEAFIARPLLVALIGMAVVGVFISALQQVVAGPLLLGPVFAFGIAISDLSLFGLGPFFWALVLGLTISRLVERDAWRALQDPARRSPTSA